MFDLPILDIAISLSFLYGLLSLFATVVQEMFASLLQLRGRMLHHGLKRMLDDGDAAVLVREFYAHPLVKYMSKSNGRDGQGGRPSYLSRATFLTAFRDLLLDKAAAAGCASDEKPPSAIAFAITRAGHLLPKSTAAVLQSFWREAQGDVQAFEKRLGEWFDDSMARVSGWYKRQSQLWGMGLGLVFALAMNVDTLAIAKKLANDTQARQALTAQAQAFAATETAAPARPVLAVAAETGADSITWAQWTHRFDSLSTQAKAVGSQIGEARNAAGLGWWRDPACDDRGLLYPGCLVLSTLRHEFCSGRKGGCAELPWGAFFFFMLFKAMGYAATACAISLGAPFWFDMLSRLTKLRGSGTKPQAETKAG